MSKILTTEKQPVRVPCERCNGDARNRGGLVEWPDGCRTIYCQECLSKLPSSSGVLVKWGKEVEG